MEYTVKYGGPLLINHITIELQTEKGYIGNKARTVKTYEQGTTYAKSGKHVYENNLWAGCAKTLKSWICEEQARILCKGEMCAEILRWKGDRKNEENREKWGCRGTQEMKDAGSNMKNFWLTQRVLWNIDRLLAENKMTKGLFGSI